MIGRITTETACAVTRTPFERVSQYLKRGQLLLEMDKAEPRPKPRGWLVIDVVKLAALRELTDTGFMIGTAAAFVRSKSLDQTMWEELGCRGLDLLTAPNAPQWFILVTRDAESSEAAIKATNSEVVAKSAIFPAPGIGGERPRVSVIIDMTAIACDIRRKLEAIG